jgi:conjugal transfer/entry exclusion protein
VETEQRLMHQKAYTLEVDQAFSLVMQIVNVINRTVSNSDERQGIKAGIGKLLTVYKQSYEEEIIDAEVIDGAAEESGEYQDNSQSTEEVHPTE